MEKKCTKCDVVKTIASFNKRKNYCKECEKLQMQKYYANNKEKYSVRMQKYYANNKEKYSVRSVAWYEKNKDLISQKMAILYANNTEKFSEKNKKYRNNNKEKLTTYAKEYLKNGVLTLSDVYVKSLISKFAELKITDIPQELIEAKRIELKLNRFIKEIKSENIIRY